MFPLVGALPRGLFWLECVARRITCAHQAALCTLDRIMDALGAELLVTPLRKVSLDGVAPPDRTDPNDRDQLIKTTGVRQIGRFPATVQAALTPTRAPVERIAGSLAAALHAIHTDPP
jgi:hypothetical protein